MAAQIVKREDLYVLNHCAKHLARENSDSRNDFGQFAPGDWRARISESWRFPIVDAHGDSDEAEAERSNQVTFVYMRPDGPPPTRVLVVGTFAALHEPMALRAIPDTPYFTLTVVVPKGEVHTYKYLVDDRLELDPINPQQTLLDNGRSWSRFFTELCTEPLSLEDWEIRLLQRLTDHILPFRTPDAERFLARFYDGLDRSSRERQLPHVHRLDESVGVVNFIDKLLAREENHHLVDYQICLELIDQVLRQRNPVVEPSEMSKEVYADLYAAMATDSVLGWDTGRYGSPAYFLQLLRRHTLTGAFSHPRHGGNVGAAGWAWLEERYRDATGKTLFDWRRSMEPPLGSSPDYRG